ncbi:Phospholipase D-like domain at C-terminus of MIT [Salinimicrobium catena]|uniref:Phospholipase D-like domain at C-terminus of MIT n=1 Tax=Salinimicrobium catena TaxID=390640 RepID=A0A1H5N4A5_9FLAO|nr:MIT C-terminal domain-containing protein [Salinimicrobium catena]SDL36645.1 Phospholipase D-like domain at C-terminus of MIT [Salinimicrobium catena]SEE96449.1 Phospholipase D-like domain at C-terminus of MIT [Salinimicrobium catena]
MVKKEAIKLINNTIEVDELNTKNTTFASVSVSGTRAAWWMNIKRPNFKKEWNIILVEQDEVMWLKIPANTFINPDQYFRIWESKNAADLLISSDPQDRYLTDISTGGTGVDFKPFVVQKVTIPEEMKADKKTPKSSYSKPELISFTSVPNLDTDLQKQRIIKQDQTNITYKKLFEGHLKGADIIKLQDPWIRLPYQFSNLLEFCVMLGNSNESGKTINLKVVSWNSKDFQSQSIESFEEIAAVVQEMGINLTYTLERHHDRYIEANNGFKIILGRGLDIFEKREGRFCIGDVDQRWRKCKPCEITYLKRNLKLFI